jgi:hypothetical protein
VKSTYIRPVEETAFEGDDELGPRESGIAEWGNFAFGISVFLLWFRFLCRIFVYKEQPTTQ